MEKWDQEQMYLMDGVNYCLPGKQIQRNLQQISRSFFPVQKQFSALRIICRMNSGHNSMHFEIPMITKV